MAPVPRLVLPPAPGGFRAQPPFETLPWEVVPPLHLVRTQDGKPPEQPTVVRACWDGAALYVRWECADRDAWSTFTRRDEPLYEEEVVELFLAAGEPDPVEYFELEIAPTGVLWDGRIHNPGGRVESITGDTGWDCPGLVWEAGRMGAAQDWWAALALPWRSLPPGDGRPLPRLWRANFYRIDRPRAGGAPEHSAWSPTFTDPPDFHRPDRFGVLDLGRE